MSCWVVVPIKAPDACKTRLAGVLPDAARAALVRRMLGKVLAAASNAAGVDRVLLLGPPDYALPAGIDRLDDPGGGLNAALAHARGSALAAGATRMIVLPADLPAITTSDVEQLAASAAAIDIAPDRTGIGTNALSLLLPAAAAFGFGFGEGSFARHRAEAERLGLTVVVRFRPGLALDIDLPEDLPALPAQARR